MRFFISFLLCILSLPALAESRTAIIGAIQVIDGETLEIQNQRIKLWGVDAPELNQTCKNGQDAGYDCGKEAASALSQWLTELQPVRCEPRGNDNSGNTIAICYTSTGDDIASWMVRNGYAVDWPKYSNGFYGVSEKQAQSNKSGIWQHNEAAPWKLTEK
ncbi:thermonuclease family protein [Bartonella apis]|uniref:Endonuclease YncB, thermonuclease family n=1 Tax=Bartonella apis TaxID=1686310 RepID=A0A1R0F701_9HYPH|nr:thermonuclease family protein [Bartonella apis]MCT6823494.1 thermonuclease family protein [Bartonella apis]MCT6859996.1 thermonuclease family protein [Bartonella apis]OLY42692.1 Endonuclease YncB, thermonuclease family [Bartonella apis]OLY45712.1 Endonuclease YncB, thermonuclease family [Bartonella apis]